MCTKAVRDAMVARGGGRIVNGSSAGAFMPAGIYGISKLALHSATVHLASELGPLGINVNAVAPGPVETALTLRDHTAETRAAYNALVPLERYGTPQEIAAAVAFLASAEASYINGQTLCVDGGFTAAGMIARDVVKRPGG